MEFIRHKGDLRCSGCGEIEANRIVYNQFFKGKQIHLFVCRCGEWTWAHIGFEAGDSVPKDTRLLLKAPDYGTNWN